MTRNKKLVFSLSETLCKGFDETLERDCKKRSEFINETLIIYSEENNASNIIEQMKMGYKDMANINLELCECGFDCFEVELNEYEAQLSESDMPDDNNNREKRRYILC